jgi:salicylate hydroxylase
MSSLRDWWPFDFYSIAWLAPGKHLLIYPISNNETLNIVAFVTTTKEELGDTKESWTLTGDKADVLREFKDFDAPAVRAIENMNTKPHKWVLYDRQPFKQWVFADGKVALLGDAAHAMLPHQGAQNSVNGLLLFISQLVDILRTLKEDADIASSNRCGSWSSDRGWLHP